MRRTRREARGTGRARPERGRDRCGRFGFRTPWGRTGWTPVWRLRRRRAEPDPRGLRSPQRRPAEAQPSRRPAERPQRGDARPGALPGRRRRLPSGLAPARTTFAGRSSSHASSLRPRRVIHPTPSAPMLWWHDPWWHDPCSACQIEVRAKDGRRESRGSGARKAGGSAEDSSGSLG